MPRPGRSQPGARAGDRSHVHPYPDDYPFPDGDAFSRPNSDSHPQRDAHRTTLADCDLDAESHLYGYRNVNLNGHRNSYPDFLTDGDQYP